MRLSKRGAPMIRPLRPTCLPCWPKTPRASMVHCSPALSPRFGMSVSCNTASKIRTGLVAGINASFCSVSQGGNWALARTRSTEIPARSRKATIGEIVPARVRAVDVIRRRSPSKRHTRRRLIRNPLGFPTVIPPPPSGSQVRQAPLGTRISPYESWLSARQRRHSGHSIVAASRRAAPASTCADESGS